MNNIDKNGVVTRKATPEEIKMFEKLIEKDRGWYSCDNCANYGFCQLAYTNKWCEHFKFEENKEED